MTSSKDALLEAVGRILAGDTDRNLSSHRIFSAVSAEEEQLDFPDEVPMGQSEEVQRWRRELTHVMKTADVRMIPLHAHDYPALLRSTSLAPPLLFTRGDAALLRSHAVAIVGSRRIDARIGDDTLHLSETLATAGSTIVSGLALGTDTAAHRGALLSGTGRTVAVLPSGIAHPYPAENADLLNQIMRVGVAVSQFLPWDAPVRETFLARNATISGLSLVSVVMAAHERSGTRNEIGHAVSQGRLVLLWESGVGRQAWADDLVTRGKARFVRSATEVSDAVEEAKQS